MGGRFFSSTGECEIQASSIEEMLDSCFGDLSVGLLCRTHYCWTRQQITGLCRVIPGSAKRAVCSKSRHVGRGERWARGVTRRVMLARTASSVVPDASDVGVTVLEARTSSARRWWQESPVTQSGEHDISQEATRHAAQGKAGVIPLHPLSSCKPPEAMQFLHAAPRGAARTRSSLRPLVLEERTKLENLGRKTCRENAKR